MGLLRNPRLGQTTPHHRQQDAGAGSPRPCPSRYPGADPEQVAECMAPWRQVTSLQENEVSHSLGQRKAKRAFEELQGWSKNSFPLTSSQAISSPQFIWWPLCQELMLFSSNVVREGSGSPETMYGNLCLQQRLWMRCLLSEGTVSKMACKWMIRYRKQAS